MFRFLALFIGALGLFAGAAGFLLLRFLPPAAPMYWLLPPALMLGGGWLITRRWGARTLLTALVVAVGTAYALGGAIWPRYGHPPSVATMSDKPPTASRNFGIAPTVERVLEVPARFRRGPFAETHRLSVPAGFRISVFAAGLGSPRFLAVGPDGSLYVSVPQQGRVLVLPDADRDGVADRVVVFAEGLGRPHGLAFRGNDLIIAETGRLLDARDDDGDFRADSIKVLSTDLAAGGGHWTRTVAVGPDDQLYVSAGSSCNACLEADWRRAAVLRFAPAGGQATLYASGLRNSVGLAFHPQTGELWASENGRDLLGDDLPPEEVNRLVEGGHYGWPYCYGRRLPDPQFGSAGRCSDSIAPEVEMPAHSAPLGITFGYGLDFPEIYRNMLFVAFHGSWNRTVPTGYKLVGIPFAEGRPMGPAVDLVSGWLHGAIAWGRPVDPVVGADGALYLSDDRAGAVYRITTNPQ